MTIIHKSLLQKEIEAGRWINSLQPQILMQSHETAHSIKTSLQIAGKLEETILD